MKINTQLKTAIKFVLLQTMLIFVFLNHSCTDRNSYNQYPPYNQIEESILKDTQQLEGIYIYFKLRGGNNESIDVVEKAVDINLFQDGISFMKHEYEIVDKDGIVLVHIKEDLIFKSIRIEISSNEYKNYSKNILFSDFEQNKTNLGEIRLERHDFSIANIVSYTTDKDNQRLNFELTFYNAFNEPVLINNIGISAKIYQNCSSSPKNLAFASIAVNELIYIDTSSKSLNTGVNMTGTITNEQGMQSKIKGKMIYKECEGGEISLSIPVSVIVPESKYSKLKFSIPNDIKIYKQLEEPKLSNFQKLVEFRTVKSLFQAINDVIFTVSTDLKDNYTLYKEFRDFSITSLPEEK